MRLPVLCHRHQNLVARRGVRHTRQIALHLCQRVFVGTRLAVGNAAERSLGRVLCRFHCTGLRHRRTIGHRSQPEREFRLRKRIPSVEALLHLQVRFGVGIAVGHGHRVTGIEHGIIAVQFFAVVHRGAATVQFLDCIFYLISVHISRKFLKCPFPDIAVSRRNVICGQRKRLSVDLLCLSADGLIQLHCYTVRTDLIFVAVIIPLLGHVHIGRGRRVFHGQCVSFDFRTEEQVVEPVPDLVLSIEFHFDHAASGYGHLVGFPVRLISLRRCRFCQRIGSRLCEFNGNLAVGTGGIRPAALSGVSQCEYRSVQSVACGTVLLEQRQADRCVDLRLLHRSIRDIVTVISRIKTAESSLCNGILYLFSVGILRQILPAVFPAVVRRHLLSVCIHRRRGISRRTGKRNLNAVGTRIPGLSLILVILPRLGSADVHRLRRMSVGEAVAVSHISGHGRLIRIRTVCSGNRIILYFLYRVLDFLLAAVAGKSLEARFPAVVCGESNRQVVAVCVFHRLAVRIKLHANAVRPDSVLILSIIPGFRYGNLSDKILVGVFNMVLRIHAVDGSAGCSPVGFRRRRLLRRILRLNHRAFQCVETEASARSGLRHRIGASDRQIQQTDRPARLYFHSNRDSAARLIAPGFFAVLLLWNRIGRI